MNTSMCMSLSVAAAIRPSRSRQKIITGRFLSSLFPEDSVSVSGVEEAQRVWNTHSSSTHKWSSLLPKESMPSLVRDINRQEIKGGRMAQKQLGVLREDPSEDMRLLMENYTVPSLASALRDREELLQQCAELCKRKKFEQVTSLLQPFQHEHIQRRRENEGKLALDQEFNASSLEILRKALMRMPRRVVHAHQKRAGVVLGLANVAGIPSVLLEKRAAHLRAHPEEVCLPGGMVCSVADDTIVSTCLREMREEIGGLTENITVLGVLRCNWGEVHHLVGVAVTPLVCFLGDLTDSALVPNPDEVAEVFTIPLSTLIQRDFWIHREGFAPIFLGGPHAIWGLTGYILERFVKDILSHHHAGTP